MSPFCGQSLYIIPVSKYLGVSWVRTVTRDRISNWRYDISQREKQLLTNLDAL